MPRSIDPLRQLEIYRSFFEKASDLLLIVDSQGIIQNANPMWETALGYSVQETIDQPIINFIHPDDIALRMKAAAQTLEGEEQTSLEIRYLTKSGKVRWFRWRANAFKGFIFGIGQDVTAERASKIKLEDTNSLLSNALVQERQWRTMAEAQQVRLRDLFNQVPMIAAVFSGPDHMIELANPSFYHLVNFRNVMGRPAFEALPMMDDVTARTLRRVFESGERFVGRNFAMTADWAASGEPTEKLFHLIFEPIKNSSGQVEAIWSLAFDVTEQAELEAKLRSTERMASLGEMAAGVGHEINNPLAYSLLNLDLLTEKLGSTFGSRDEIPLLLKELLRKSVDGLDRVRDIVKGLKAFSRQDESHLEPLDIREPLRIALNFTANETRHRAKVITEFEDAALVVANTGRLTQVFTNLLVNAAQALDIDRANENTIRVKVFLSEDRKVIVDVIDSGCGIPAHLLPRVFEPFYTSKPVGVGTGLGLSICHGIISNFGGDIQIASEVGKGTRVRISLPSTDMVRREDRANVVLTEVDRDPDAAGNTNAAAATRVPIRKRILVIDDDQALREVIVAALESEHDVVALESAVEALGHLDKSQNSYDWVICDLMMPAMTGMEFYEIIRARGMGFEKKIILITGGAFTPKIRGWMETLTNPKLEKPFRMKQLKELLNQSR